MEIKGKVHCFFEQSGTFKNEFIKLGIPSEDYDIQNNFGKYLKAVQEGNEIIILKKGKEVARLISKDTGISFLTDSLTGILKKDYNEKDIRTERIAEKYENID